MPLPKEYIDEVVHNSSTCRLSVQSAVTAHFYAYVKRLD